VSGPVLAQALVSGLLIGFVFALIAAGLSLIFGVMEIVNFAHGEFLMLSMYLSYFLHDRKSSQPSGWECSCRISRSSSGARTSAR